jgi:hypothetical protein
MSLTMEAVSVETDVIAQETDQRSGFIRSSDEALRRLATY